MTKGPLSLAIVLLTSAAVAHPTKTEAPDQATQFSYARVGHTGGNKGRSTDINNVARESPGTYRISYDRDINSCVNLVTITFLAQPNEPSVQGSTATTHPQGKDLVVFTAGSTGALQDHAFVVLTYCP